MIPDSTLFVKLTDSFRLLISESYLGITTQLRYMQVNTFRIERVGEYIMNGWNADAYMRLHAYTHVRSEEEASLEVYSEASLGALSGSIKNL